MKDLYDKTCAECSTLVTHRYSTSFSIGIRAFQERFRQPIYNIYGFVRFADEIVDTFHDHNKEELLEEFRQDTFKAIYQGISLNPILQSFQETVNKYNIDHSHIVAFMDSMAMDLEDQEYDKDLLKKYIYGSAEVVGLMCLKVFVENNEELYQELEPYAISLGSAFQKINFLRDIKDDFHNKGRTYFPELDMTDFSQSTKEIIEADILKDFDHALIGIRKLPIGVRLGVFIAYKYYTKLFCKIKRSSPDQVLKNRIRISDARKLLVFSTSTLRNWSGMIA